MVLLALLILISGCNSTSQTLSPSSESTAAPAAAPAPVIKQVETPALIQELEPWLDNRSPQVQIQQPAVDQIFDDTTIDVVLQVQDLPIYRDEIWGMGPHLELILDNQPYASIYDLKQPIPLKDLTPGTHTIRAFAARPWYESFKNEGAYAQVTFHVFAKTDENTPTSNQPLLTYGAPFGTYGAEPVLLDFYLTETPLHQVAQDNPMISDWRVRYTINGDRFTLNNWEPTYIKGLKPGQNWVQVTLVDDADNPIEGVFNNTVRLIEYDPTLNDGLANIVRGGLTLEEVGGIVDPTYEPPVPDITEPDVPVNPVIEDDDENVPLDNASEEKASEAFSSEVNGFSEVNEFEEIEPKRFNEPNSSSDAALSEGELEESEGDDILDDSGEAISIYEDEVSDDLEAVDAITPEIFDEVPADTTDLENVSQSDQEAFKAESELSDFPLEAKIVPELETALDNQSESSEPIDDDATTSDLELEDKQPDDEGSLLSNGDEVRPPAKRRYLQQIYDYRDRAMQKSQDR